MLVLTITCLSQLPIGVLSVDLLEQTVTGERIGIYTVDVYLFIKYDTMVLG